MDQGLPRAIQLGEDLPVAVRAYRRFKVDLSTTQNSYGPNSIVDIPIDTGTHGTFFDTRTPRLQFDIDIISRNGMADFTSFGRAGMDWLFEEMGLEVNGVPVEMNRQYGAVSELEKIRRGLDPDPYFMTFPNKYKVGQGLAGSMHINFIKPPMVNASGRPWDIAKSVNLSNLFYDSTSITQPVLPTDPGDGAIPTTFNTIFGIGGLWRSAADTYGATSTDKYGNLFVSAKQGSPMGGPYYCGVDWEGLQDDVARNASTRNDMRRVANGYCNVKYLPIMAIAKITPTIKSFIGSVSDNENVTGVLTGSGTTHSYHVSLPLNMGIIGQLNPKWFPALAIGGGRMKLRIKLARPEHFFQLTLDPNRRVPGTMRDIAPFRLGYSPFVPPTTVGDVPDHVSWGLFALTDKEYNVSAGATDATCAHANSCLRDSVAIGCCTIAGIAKGSKTAFTDADELLTQTTLVQEVFAAPLCQYITVTRADLARTGVDGSAFVSEAGTCFGTNRPYGRPQSRRTCEGAFPLDIPVSTYSYGVTYNVRGFALHTEEVMFSDAVTDSLLRAGTAGAAVTETVIFKETKAQLHATESQKILIPLTGASIVDVCVAFRHQEQLSSSAGWAQKTYSFINPFAKFNATPQLVTALGSLEQHTLETALDSSDNTGINVQFMLGSEYLPRVPINTVSRLVEFVTQGDQVFYGAGDLGSYRAQGSLPEYCDFSSTMIPNPTILDNKHLVDPLKDGFFSAFLPLSHLDDQTVTDNPYLLANTGNVAMQSDFRCPFLEPFTGTFHLSLNMESFMGMGTRMRTGTTIVNNQLFLKMDRAIALKESSYEMIAYARCNAKLVFERGGNMQVIS